MCILQLKQSCKPLGQARCHSRKPPENASIVFAAQCRARLLSGLIGRFQECLNLRASDWLRELSVLVACQQPSGRGGEPSAFRFWAGLTHNEEQRLGRRSANAAVNKYNNHWGQRKMENQVRWLLCLMWNRNFFRRVKVPAGTCAGCAWNESSVLLARRRKKRSCC